MTGKLTLPKSTLSAIDVSALIVGMVIGAGIFETPALVATHTGSSTLALFAWVLGGGVSLIGALCFAELATTYPHMGGIYHYLMRAYGKPLAFLFGWARMTVIQTGSIALVAFVFGDYAAQLLPLGEGTSAFYAALAIAGLTGLNLLGVQQGKWTQNLLTVIKVLGLLLIVGVGLLGVVPLSQAASPTPTTQTMFGLAMIFVLLTYGGWNEAAYLSAELRENQRNMSRVLLSSIGLITVIYLLINLAYLHGLGLSGMADSTAVAADLMRRAIGGNGAKFVSGLIALSALGATNATIFTGARTNYVLGQDFPQFTWLGRWQERTDTPSHALWVQGAIALALVLLGALTRKGFETMTYYTAPVFWFFFLLSGLALLVLRVREPEVPRPFQVPVYPLVPLLFCATCGYLLYSSLKYASSQPTGVGVYLGVAVLLLGLPLFWLSQRSPQ